MFSTLTLTTTTDHGVGVWQVWWRTSCGQRSWADEMTFSFTGRRIQ